MPKQAAKHAANWLGEKGVPGFRSGTLWKMVLATIVYIAIFLAVLTRFVG